MARIMRKISANQIRSRRKMQHPSYMVAHDLQQINKKQQQNTTQYLCDTRRSAPDFTSSTIIPSYYTLPVNEQTNICQPYNGMNGRFCDIPFSFPFPNYSALDICSTRRKNATRETTSILKRWLNEHKKNPYPTKAEKIMLSVMTKMSLTQVSTWFANARRRLKKENKMTWDPKPRIEAGESDHDRECYSESIAIDDQEYCTSHLNSDKKDDAQYVPLNKRKIEDSFYPQKSERKRVKFSSVDDLAKSDCLDNQSDINFSGDTFKLSLYHTFFSTDRLTNHNSSATLHCSVDDRFAKESKTSTQQIM